MSKQITLTLPEDVYDQATSVAQATHQPINEVLQDALKHVFSPFPLHKNHADMVRETEAYKAIHADLVRTHLDQFVAIYQGNLIDHDQDIVALSTRINQRLPETPVLIRRVEKAAERILHNRSPRFLRKL